MTTHSIEELANAIAFDSNGDKLGDVKQVFTNDATGEPDFIEVAHGLFGMGSSLVPLRGYRLDEEGLHLAFEKDRIKDAPDLADEGHLTPEDQDTLYRHYGVGSLADGAAPIEDQAPRTAPESDVPAAAPVAPVADEDVHEEDRAAEARHLAD